MTTGDIILHIFCFVDDPLSARYGFLKVRDFGRKLGEAIGFLRVFRQNRSIAPYKPKHVKR